MPNINSIYSELSSDWSTSNSSSYDDAIETSILEGNSKYIIIANAQCGSSASLKSPEIKTSYDSSTIIGSSYKHTSSSSFHENRYSFFSIITTTASPGTVKMQVKAESGSSATVKTASVVCLNINNLSEGADYIYSENNTNSSNSPSFEEKTSIEIPATKQTSGPWLLLSHSQYDVQTLSSVIEQKVVFKGTEDLCFTRQSFLRISDYCSNYTQKILSIPFVGYPSHLGGTDSDGAYKKISLQGRDSQDRPTKNVCTSSRLLGLRLSAFQDFKYDDSDLNQTLLSPGSYDEIATIDDYRPPQDDSLTSSNEYFTSAKSLVLGYYGFKTNGTSGSDKRCYMDISWEEGGSDNSIITGLGDDTIANTNSQSDISPVGFCAIKDVGIIDQNKTIKLKSKTFGIVSEATEASVCVLGLGEPVSSFEIDKRAKLEPSSIIRLS